MKRKKTNWNTIGWTPFRQVDAPAELPANDGAWTDQRLVQWFENSIYVVRLMAVKREPPFGAVVSITVRTHDLQARHDWRELQRIKNELVGPKVEAVEVYPSEDRLVDNANYYHLFCFPELATEDGWLPFGFTERRVTEGNVEGHKQRDFRPELRPEDVLVPGPPGSPRRSA